jgi:predicted amidohydrolase
LTVTVATGLLCSAAWAEDSQRSFIKIAGLQMRVTRDIDANERRILDGIEKAAQNGADFLATPEGSLSGYRADFERVVLIEALERVVAAARKAKVGLALGTCFKEKQGTSERCYNQIRFYAPEGEYLGSHSKILRCSPLDYPGTGEMNHYVEGRLRTFTWRGIRFGALICNDFWATPGFTTKPNPYLPWKLRQMGAQVIFHAINSGSSQQYRQFHESSVELWAKALKIPVIEVNAAAPEGKQVNATSGVVGPDGQRVLRANDTGERFFVHKLALPGREPRAGD